MPAILLPSGKPPVPVEAVDPGDGPGPANTPRGGAAGLG
jgi:hypothetical protein